MDVTSLTQFLQTPLALASIELIAVDIPQKEVFQSAIGTRKSRRALLVKWHDKSGFTGYGECSCRPDPFYSHEFVDGAGLVIENYIFPLLSKVSTYNDLLEQLRKIRGWNFTKAAVEAAANEAIRARSGIGILEAAGLPMANKVPVGISLGLFNNVAAIQEKIAEINDQGYKRLKFKISRDYADPAIINTLAKLEHPYISLDANGSFTASHFNLLNQYAELDYIIEQPFPPGEFYLYSQYQMNFKAFPICLDEEVESYGNLIDNHRYIAELNIKPGRVGGLWNSLKMIDFCNTNNLKAWIGGMFESGIGRAQNLRLAALLPDAKAHDLSPSSRYFTADLLTKPIEMEDGLIDSSYFNIIEIDESALNRMTTTKKILNTV